MYQDAMRKLESVSILLQIDKVFHPIIFELRYMLSNEPKSHYSLGIYVKHFTWVHNGVGVVQKLL